MPKKKIAGVLLRRVEQRRLHEEFAVPLEVIAVAAGLQPAFLERTARREGWSAPPQADTPERRDEKIALMMDRMVAELEGVKKDGRTKRYDKARIDALSAMMRMLEKLSEINENRQARQEEEQKTDADIADTLRRIDERIVALAREFARELVGDRLRDGEGAGASRA